jgi:hypothetical protein
LQFEYPQNIEENQKCTEKIDLFILLQSKAIEDKKGKTFNIFYS